ncbi:MAG: hypothetical protein ACR2PM_09845, partial [Hyphomicrobiales bacterium]
VHGYGEHTRDSRRLDRLLRGFAKTHGGRITRKKFLTLPRFRFQRDGRNAWLGAMATAGPPADPGPFTSLDLELPHDTGQHLRIERTSSGVMGCAARVADMVLATHNPATGDARFDKAFRITGPDHALAARLLDANIREKLLASPAPQLDLQVAGPTVSVHRNGIAATQDELEEMVAVATLVAERC